MFKIAFLIIITSDTSRLPTATLIVSSVPSGAKVYIENVYQDTTPITIQNLVIWKRYSLRLEKEGYETFCDTIIFRTPITLEKNIVLQEKEKKEEKPKLSLQNVCTKAKEDAKEDISSFLWTGMG